METLSPVALENVVVVQGSLPVEHFSFEINAASPAVPPDDSADEDLDGCEVQVEVATSDEDLPPAEGGVA